MVRRFVALGVPRAGQAERLLDPRRLKRGWRELERAAEDLARAIEGETIPEIFPSGHMRSKGVRPHRFTLRVAFPDPRGILRTKRLPPVVRERLDVIRAQTLAGVLRVEAQARADRQAAVRDVMHERVIEAEVTVDRADVSEVGEAAESAGDVRRITVRQKRGAPHVECLTDHRRALEQLPIGRQKLVKAGADRRLHRDGENRFAGSACPGELDDE
jgi:hypothetical protein